MAGEDGEREGVDKVSTDAPIEIASFSGLIRPREAVDPNNPLSRWQKNTKRIVDWFDRQEPHEQRNIAINALILLYEKDSVSFGFRNGELTPCDPCVIPDLRIPF